MRYFKLANHLRHLLVLLSVFFLFTITVFSFWFPTFSFEPVPKARPVYHEKIIESMKHYPFEYLISVRQQRVSYQGSAGQIASSSSSSYELRNNIVQSLLLLSKKSNDFKKGSVIYLPTALTESIFLDWPNNSCNVIQMIIPSITDIPMLNGTPSAKCNPIAGLKSLGLWYSGIKISQLFDTDQKSICQSAKQLGFYQVINIDDKGNIQVWKC